MYRSFCLIILFWVLPMVSKAAILINEIAWMGDATSANNEWIELYNDGGEAVDVSGWTLSFGTTNITIGAGKVIEAGEYVLLERNRSGRPYLSSPEPFHTYTGALANTGVLLILRDREGNERHRADGRDNWSIGGDNSTKATAQLTASGWITAMPTPLTANTNPPQVVEPQLRGGSGASSRVDTVLQGTTTERIYSNATLMATELTVEIVADDIAFVGQETELARNVSGMPETILQSLKYDWNFGDGFVKNPLEKVKHTYREPGNYIVTVRAAFANYEAFARHNITVLPIILSLERQSDDRLSLHNDSGYEIDVSGYQIVTPNRVFTMPPYTLMGARGTITLPASILNIGSNEKVWLRDKTGKVVANMTEVGKVLATTASNVVATNRTVNAAVATPVPNSNFRFAGDEVVAEVLEITEEMLEERESVDFVEEELETGIDNGGVNWAQVVFWVFLLLIIGAVFVTEKIKKEDS